MYSKHDFWESNFKMCLVCKEINMATKDIVLVRDPDGRSRGMTEFTCKVQRDTTVTPRA
jgi:hypothetical protein